MRSIPPHVPPSRVRDIDMYGYPVCDGEPQLGLLALRQEGAPETFWSPHNGGHWVVTRASTIEAVINDAERFSNRYVGVPKELNPVRIFRPFQMDAPDHIPYRNLMSALVSPRAVAAIQADARRLAVDLIEGFKAKGECEFVTDFAQHMPIRMFMTIVGLPEEDRLPLLAMAEKIARPKADAERMEGYALFDAYAMDLIAKRRGGSDGDFVADLCRATIDGEPLSEDALIGMITLVMIAGLDTVSGMLGFFALFLARNPDRRQALREHPELIPGAVEELLRRFAHPMMAREARCDVELDGVAIRKGDMVVAPLALFNLDEAKFPEPLKIDFERPRRPAHVTFGGQPHRCLGAMLARTELAIFLEEWLARIPDFQVRPGTELAARTRVTAVLVELPLVWPAG
jgi:cytochrome P450